MIEYEGKIIQKDKFSEDKKHKQQIADLEFYIDKLKGIIEKQREEIDASVEKIAELKERVDRDRVRLANLKVKVQGSGE